MTQQYGVDTKPYQLHITQFEIPEGQSSNLSKTALNKLVAQFKQAQTNPVLPLACVTDDEEKYCLLTGYDIYNAAKLAGFNEMWVFIIAAPKQEALQWIDAHSELSKLNDALVEPEDARAFIEFINKPAADLTAIAGIGSATADKIVAKRPYKDLTDLQSKLGKKRTLSWIRAYKTA